LAVARRELLGRQVSAEQPIGANAPMCGTSWAAFGQPTLILTGCTRDPAASAACQEAVKTALAHSVFMPLPRPTPPSWPSRHSAP
jgi:hypothetical protein